ncbi:MAG: hypothetical protein IT201_02350 [Thermoleophilia bacterium]|nr:hypothetical protein [Thermoleophilia bacterium]
MSIGAETATPRELFSRRAVKDGRTVVHLRAVDVAGDCVIETDVYPVTGLGVDPLPLGPFSFGTMDAGVTFVEEALLALEYLGCSIVQGGTGEPGPGAAAPGT